MAELHVARANQQEFPRGNGRGHGYSIAERLGERTQSIGQGTHLLADTIRAGLRFTFAHEFLQKPCFQVEIIQHVAQVMHMLAHKCSDTSAGNIRFGVHLRQIRYDRASWSPRSSVMNTILLIVLVLLLIGALPTWPYSSGWGYGPSGGLGLVLVILLILALLGKV